MHWKEVEEMNFEDILYHHDTGIARITINRPHVRNAFRPETIQELMQAAVVCKSVNAFGIKNLGKVLFSVMKVKGNIRACR